MDVEADKCTLFSPRGALTSDELDLIDISGNTLLLDHLLPDKPVAVGRKWRPAEKSGRLLQLDEVRRSDVECVLNEVTPGWPGSGSPAACREASTACPANSK